jgi:hypothetical protein
MCKQILAAETKWPNNLNCNSSAVSKDQKQDFDLQQLIFLQVKFECVA